MANSLQLDFVLGHGSFKRYCNVVNEKQDASRVQTAGSLVIYYRPQSAEKDYQKCSLDIHMRTAQSQ